MKKQKEKKSLLEYLDNRDAMLLGFAFIFISFIFLIIFFLLQKPMSTKVADVPLIYYPKHLYKSLFVFAVIFALMGFLICEIYLLRIIRSLRIVNKWTWQTKSKLQTILISIPTAMFIVLVICFFGSLFITGTTMSTYGYNKFTRLYLYIIYPITFAAFLLCITSFSPWIYTPWFEKLTLKYK